MALSNLSPDLPKVINPKTHAALDFLTTGAFLIAASLFWRSNKRAAAAALINGAAVAVATFLTDYDGDGKRPLSFAQHKQFDLVQAGMAATMPTVMGFGDTKASTFFRGQAMNELMVVGMTDWDATEPLRGVRGAA